MEATVIDLRVEARRAPFLIIVPHELPLAAQSGRVNQIF